MTPAASFLYKVLVGYALTTGTLRGVGAEKAADKLDEQVLPRITQGVRLRDSIIETLNRCDSPRAAFLEGQAIAARLKALVAAQEAAAPEGAAPEPEAQELNV